MQNFLKIVFLFSLLSVAGSSAWANSYSEAIESFSNAGESGAYFKTAYGYAVFPTIGKGGFVVGGAYGKGRVFARAKHVGSSTVTQATVGFQLGGQAYSQLILFKNFDVYSDFIKGQFEFGADVTAVALTYGAQAGASTKGASASAGDTKGVATWKRGMAVYTIAKGGLMYEASIGGQKFKYKPLSD